MEPLNEKVLFKEGTSVVAFRRMLNKYDFNWHIHPEFEIVFIVKGFGTRYVGNSVEDYREAEIVFVSPGIPHAWQSAEESDENEAYVVHFDQGCFGSNWYTFHELKSAEKLILSQSSWLVEDVPQGKELFEKLIHANGLQKAANFLELLDFILKQDKRELGSMKFARSSAKVEKIEKVIDYMKSNFHELLTVDSIADNMSLSTYQLRTLFKKHTSKSVLQYLNELRVFEACRLMQNKDYTISYLSAQAGFNNLSYFNRIFLKVTGKTPREYRKVFCN